MLTRLKDQIWRKGGMKRQIKRRILCIYVIHLPGAGAGVCVADAPVWALGVLLSPLNQNLRDSGEGIRGEGL
jgi:hypothetical protein